MEGHAEQLVAHLGDLTGVHGHPDPHGCSARPGLRRQRALGLDGCRHRVAGRAEDEDAPVAAAGIPTAPARARSGREDCAVPLDDRDEGVAERPEQPRGPLHVGEEQRHDPRGLHPGRAGAAGGRPHSRRRQQASARKGRSFLHGEKPAGSRLPVSETPAQRRDSATPMTPGGRPVKPLPEGACTETCERSVVCDRCHRREQMFSGDSQSSRRRGNLPLREFCSTSSDGRLMMNRFTPVAVGALASVAVSTAVATDQQLGHPD